MPPPPLDPQVPVTPDAAAADAGQGRRLGALGAVVIAFYWTTTAAVVMTAAAVFHRRSVVDRIMNGDFGTRRPRALDHEARALIGLVSWAELVVAASAAVATALWSRRVITSARLAGIEGANPNHATIGWLIPFVWWYLGFEQLRTALGDDTPGLRSLRAWQTAFTLGTVFAVLTRGNSRRVADLAELTTGLDRQGLLILFMAAILAAAAYKAGQVIRRLDGAFSPA
jgi:hypothetical protein